MGKQINARIVSSTGETVIIDSEPGGSYISCGIAYVSAQGPTQIQGLNHDYTEAIFMTIGDTCITQPGTYNFKCQYLKNYSLNQIIFENDSVSDPGNITFEIVREDIIYDMPEVFVEGHFHATCRLNTDSVVVTGTFSGYMN